VEAELVGGYPAEKIIEIADERSPDLVVIGAVGLGAALGINLGGVAQQVTEYAHWPVLVVRAPFAGLKRILLVADGSPSSQQSVEYLAEFPLPADVDVQVLNILPSSSSPGSRSEKIWRRRLLAWRNPGGRLKKSARAGDHRPGGQGAACRGLKVSGVLRRANQRMSY
jgi:nucleotide-binding universal stress UspA family protein